MKYLLSALLFLGFIFFSIPCFAGVGTNDESVNSQDEAVDVINQALLPKEVRQDAFNQASLVAKTEIIVSPDFFADIGKSISNFGCNILQIFGLGKSCETNLSWGKDTAQSVTKSKILGQSTQPAGMELIPAENDPRLGDFNQNVTGNENLNQLSENLGTTTGFFRNDQPPLSDYGDYVQNRMKTKNLNLDNDENALFEQDRRSPDMYSSKQVFCMGHYPTVDGKAICPFEPPTP